MCVFCSRRASAEERREPSRTSNITRQRASPACCGSVVEQRTYVELRDVGTLALGSGNLLDSDDLDAPVASTMATSHVQVYK